MMSPLLRAAVLSCLVVGCTGGDPGPKRPAVAPDSGGAPPADNGGSGGAGGSGGGTAPGAGGTGGAAPDARAGGSGGGATGGSGGQATADAAPARDGATGGTAGSSGGDPPQPATPAPTDLAKHRYLKTVKMDTTAAGANVAESVANYPVVVRLNATNFDFSQAKDFGEDIRFSKMDGKLLPYAVEQWDKAAKVATVWVKVDQVMGNNASQAFQMHWGNPDAGSASDSKAVFSMADGYLGVYHLNEEGTAEVGGYKDSSAHGADLTGVMMAPGSRVDGLLGKATRLENARESYKKQWLRLDDMAKNAMFNPTGRSITASVWTKPFSFAGRSRYGSYETVMSKGDTSWTIQRVGSRDWEACTKGPGTVTWHNCAIVRGAVVTNEWIHFAIVMTDSNLAFYVNGERRAGTGNGKRTSEHPFGIGQQTQALTDGREWDGIVDEGRVLTVAKEAGWVKLDFQSQKADSKFLVFGEGQAK